MEINRSILNDYHLAREYEWIETNGLGGYSNSTIICCNEQRYHALLVAAVQPPAERLSLVSKLDETIISGDNRFELGVNNYGDTIHPNGNQYLFSFTKVLYPEFIYEANGIRLKKTVTMIHGENTVVVIYEVLSAGSGFILQLLPLFSVRNYHALAQANEQVNTSGNYAHDVFSLL